MRTTTRNRILAIVIFFLAALSITIIGVLVPLSPQEVADDNSALNKTQQEIQATSLLHRTAAIFQNNFLICLIMFIPVIGVIFGSIALFNTGNYLQAQIITDNATNVIKVPPILALLVLFIFPFTWLEFISYSTAFSESFWLLRRGLQGKFGHELLNLLKLVVITAVLLAAGAFIEAILIGLGI